MARAQASDPLHNFRFHAQILSEGSPYSGSLSTDIIGNGEAGFNAVTGPEITLEWAEYREGVRTYTEKYPGIPSWNDCTFSRGAARVETDFFDWMLAAVEGREYRANVIIYHFPREALKRPDNAPVGNAGVSLPSPAQSLAKGYRLYNAGPGRVKLAGDMDATSSDVSIKEIDVIYERSDVVVQKPSG